MRRFLLPALGTVICLAAGTPARAADTPSFTKMLSGLVGGPTRIDSSVCNGSFVDPIEKLTNVPSPQFFNWDTASPFLPLPKG
jgi:hypothetical protein